MNETTKKNTPLGLCMTYSHHPVSNITVGKRLMFVLLLDILVTKNNTKKTRNWHGSVQVTSVFFGGLQKVGIESKIYLHLQARPSVIFGDPLEISHMATWLVWKGPGTVNRKFIPLQSVSKKNWPIVHQELPNVICRTHVFCPKNRLPAPFRGRSKLVKLVLGSMME